MKTGRPSIFTPEIGQEICMRIMTLPFPKNSVRNICKAKDMPCRTSLYYWLLDAAKTDASKELKDFLNQYDVAHLVRLENMFDEAFCIAYSKRSPQNKKVIVDLLKWSLSKLNPEKYGDRIQQDHTFKQSPVTDALAAATEAALKKIEGL